MKFRDVIRQAACVCGACSGSRAAHDARRDEGRPGATHDAPWSGAARTEHERRLDAIERDAQGTLRKINSIGEKLLGSDRPAPAKDATSKGRQDWGAHEAGEAPESWAKRMNHSAASRYGIEGR